MLISKRLQRKWEDDQQSFQVSVSYTHLQLHGGGRFVCCDMAAEAAKEA